MSRVSPGNATEAHDDVTWTRDNIMQTKFRDQRQYNQDSEQGGGSKGAEFPDKAVVHEPNTFVIQEPND